jgi:molecular chaperone GrpE
MPDKEEDLNIENLDQAEEGIKKPEEEKPESPEREEVSTEDRIKELNDKYLRLYSEFENFRRRTAKERLDLLKTAGEEILTELLPVIDDFERAMLAMSEKADLKTIKEGVHLVHHKFLHTLNAKGLKPFDSKEKSFDPEFHEAVTKIPAPSKKLRGKVVDEIEKGYLLNDKVIRYAKVVVGE